MVMKEVVCGSHVTQISCSPEFGDPNPLEAGGEAAVTPPGV